MLIRTLAIALVLGNFNAFAANGEVNESYTIDRQTVYAEPKVGTILSVTPVKSDQLHLQEFDSSTGTYNAQIRVVPGSPIAACSYRMFGVATPGEPHENLYLSSRYNWKVIEATPAQELPPNRDGTYKTIPGKVVLQATGDDRLRLEITSKTSNAHCLGKAGFPPPIQIREEKIKRQEVSVEGSEATT